MAAFADNSDMLVSFDDRILGNLVRDNKIQATRQELETDPVLSKMLDRATGFIVSHSLRSQRYTREDLDNLTGEDRDFLVHVTCQIAFYYLWCRKPYPSNRNDSVKVLFEDARGVMEDIKTGQLIFPTEGAVDAGIPKIDTVSVPEAERHNLFVDHARRGLYPRRRTAK